jgi:hypothetical protein
MSFAKFVEIAKDCSLRHGMELGVGLKIYQPAVFPAFSNLARNAFGLIIEGLFSLF